MPLRVAEKPGGVGDVEAGEVLIAVGAGQFEGEGSVGGGGVVADWSRPGRLGVEGSGDARARRAARARVEGEELGRGLGGEAFESQGVKVVVTG